MKLKHFRVTNFRNFVDSGTIFVDSKITALVGKNESGKTAALQCLDRLNSSQSNKFGIQEHYPRSKLSKDRKRENLEEVVPIRATFELESDDYEAIKEDFGSKVLSESEVTVKKNYNDEMEVDFKFDEKEVLNNFLTEYQQNIPENLWDRLSNCSDYQEAINIVDQAEYNEEFSDEYAQFISQFRSCLENATVERVSQKLKNMIPRMFYFSEYSKLEGRINLTRIANLSEQKEPARTSDQTAKSFLNLAWTDIKAVSSENYEYRKSELEAVSNELTDEVTEYWRQNPDISVEIDIDNVRENGNNINKYVEFRVEDKKHRYTENLEQRSSGFRWFFSFFAAFTEFEMRKEKVVVLLDEPALSLHGRAQIDFLKFLEDRLAPNVQVIYTTHSPFLVDTSHIHRIRVVQDRSVEEGAIVDDQIVTNDRDSLFPLQGARGYDLAQNLFIGPNNLIVEGPSDFQFITAMKNMREFHGKN